MSFFNMHTQQASQRSARQQRRARRRQRNMNALAYEHTHLETQEEGVPPKDDETQTSKSALRLTIDDAWECAPSIAWVLMYFVFIGMVAVSMRFCENPFQSTKK